MLGVQRGDEGVDAGFLGEAELVGVMGRGGGGCGDGRKGTDISFDVVDADAVVFGGETAGYCFSSGGWSGEKSVRWDGASIHATARACHNCCSFPHGGAFESSCIQPIFTSDKTSKTRLFGVFCPRTKEQDAVCQRRLP